MGNEQIKIVLDLMGSDNFPTPEFEGVKAAVKEDRSLFVYLVGKREIYDRHRDFFDEVKNVEFVEAEQHIGMDESPIAAIRKKKKSTIRVGLSLLKKGKAHGFVSAGNTGAVMALSKLLLGVVEGVDRPALATAVPSIKGGTIILDVGANVECKPLHLEQFAIMGNIYYKIIFGKENPKIGLLNIGEEEIKGNDLMKEVHKALSVSSLNFIGNIEGKDVYTGDVDVVVCDGFTGNVALKISEGVISALMFLLKKEIKSHLSTKIGAIFLKKAFRNLKKDIDYSEYGGAPLLGIKYPVIICHGRSNPNAIKNALKFCALLYRQNIPMVIEEQVKEFMYKIEKEKV